MPSLPAAAANGLGTQLAHEDRLQRVESAVADVRVQVAELSVKQDFHAKINQDQNVEILAKIDKLSRASDEIVEHEHRLEKIEESKTVLSIPTKWVRKYFLHICVAIGGALGHKGWLAILAWIAHKA